MSTDATDAIAEAEANKQLITEFMEVFSTGDKDAMLEMIHPDGTWWVAGTMEGISGTKNKEEFAVMYGGIKEGCKGGAIKLTPKAFTAEGNRVAVETESYAELHNGRVYNNEYHFVFEVKDGKVLRIKEYLDTEHTVSVFIAP